MRINHISDTHSDFNLLHGSFDIVVHSGDFFPNSMCLLNKDLDGEIKFQLNWLKQKIYTIKAWLQNHPFMFILGNHDFAPPDMVEQILKDNKIDAINLTNKMISYDCHNFYGFPYVTYMDGDWNFEKSIPEMQTEVDNMVNVINDNHVDVLVAHCPPYATLDRAFSRQLIGSTVIATAIDYKLDSLSYYLTGHCHESSGVAVRNRILVSNAACTSNIIES